MSQQGYQQNYQQGYQQPPPGAYQQPPPPGAYQQQPQYQQQGGYQQQQQVPAYPTKPSPYMVAGQPQSPTASYDAYQGGAAGGTGGQAQGIPLFGDSADPAVRSRFIKQGYKDVWATVAFALVVLTTAVWGFINLAKFKQYFKADENDDDGSNSNGGTNIDSGHFTRNMARFLPLAAACALGTSCVALFLMRTFPRAYIIGANLVHIGLAGAMSVYFFVKVGTAPGVIMLIVTAFMALWFYLVRGRIPFAGELLSHAVRAVTRYYGSIVTSFGGLIVFAIYVVLFILMVIPTLEAMTNGQCTNQQVYTGADNCGVNHDEACYYTETTCDATITGGQYAACVFFLLFFYWASQVISNVVHVTAAGTVATWYYVGDDHMPPNPSVASLGRAMTTSFGSICFGSLVVAILKVIHAMVRYAVGNRTSFLACLAVCLIELIERLMQYFNVYAFVHVAIYGSSYIEAAKQTWAMIQQCFFAAIFNDCLVYPVLTLTSLILSIAIGAIMGVAASSIAIGILAFLIAYIIHVLVLRVVYSGVVTLFVCFAESPDVLKASNPTFYASIEDAAANSPKVQKERERRAAAQQQGYAGGQQYAQQQAGYQQGGYNGQQPVPY